MATLSSANKNYNIRIKPYRFENKQEGWITTELRLQHNEKDFLTTLESFLQLTEFESLIKGIKKVVNGLSENFTLEPLEPNFEFNVKYIASGKFEVKTAFFKTIDYEKGEIKKNYERNNFVIMETGKQNLISFIKQLSSEIKGLL